VEADWVGSPPQAVAGVRRPPVLVAELQLALHPSLLLPEMLLEQAIHGPAIRGQTILALTIWSAARVPRVRRHGVAAHQFYEAVLVWKVAALAQMATALAPD
jgi:hypothetical protein